MAWTLFAVVMWTSHFSPLFDAALEDPFVHELEHLLFLCSALLFWWPVVGVDPAPRRLSHPMRIGYLMVGMPFSSFLGLAIFSATGVLYAHYATLVRPWGSAPLDDQAWAGGIMWAGGDLVFLLAMVLAVGAWLRSEEVEERRVDALLDQQSVQVRRGAPDPAGAAGTMAGAAGTMAGAAGPWRRRDRGGGRGRTRTAISGGPYTPVVSGRLPGLHSQPPPASTGQAARSVLRYEAQASIQTGCRKRRWADVRHGSAYRAGASWSLTTSLRPSVTR